MHDDDLRALILAVLALAEGPLAPEEILRRVKRLAREPDPRAWVSAELARRS